MQRQIIVVCAECGNPYAARAVNDQLLVATHDGKCSCGSDAFSRVADAVDADPETTA